MFVLIAIYTFSYVSEKDVSVIEFEYTEWQSKKNMYIVRYGAWRLLWIL